MTTIKERIANATEGKMPNCAANDALTELLNPTDEMIEAMRKAYAEHKATRDRQSLDRLCKEMFTAAIKAELES